MPEEDWRFACPRCSGELSADLACVQCGTRLAYRDGIYRCLLPGRLEELEPFLGQYRRVREKEGYRSRSPEYYRGLPQVDPASPQSAKWRVRRQSFDRLRRYVLPQFGRRSLAILDLGGGNGWLSHRLSALGHRCAVVDWLDDDEDGLGVHKVYPFRFACVQADFDRLPFAPGQFDLAIFNASLHYAPDVAGTLRRARHMLAAGGALVVMDSPTFHSDRGGSAMLADQRRWLRNGCGLDEVMQIGAGYLTVAGMKSAGRSLGMDFRFYPSKGGPGWALRRLVAMLRNRREAAAFGLWLGK